MRSATPLENERVTLGPGAARLALLLLAGGLALVGIAVALGMLRGDQMAIFLHSYLVSYCFYLSLALGALGFVALQHAARAGWSVAVRRLAELLAATLPMMALLFLPILAPMLLGNFTLYPWADPQVLQRDTLLQAKLPYLNVPFFAARAVGYFGIWALLARFFLRKSVEQDASGDPHLTIRMERAGAPALILFGLTLTFASFDWLMSLTPHWFSTIYGVYFFSGAAVGGLAVIILAAMLVQSAGRLRAAISVEHYHDLGKLLFAFVVFWGYIAFSQYLLIWYANLPEETVWYQPRHAGPWGAVSLVLLLGHLLVPFLGLMSRHVKRNRPALAFWASWLLAMHWLDLYWLVMPSIEPRRVPLAAIDALLLVGLGGLFVAAVIRAARRHALVPVRDPRLLESLTFENL